MQYKLCLPFTVFQHVYYKYKLAAFHYSFEVSIFSLWDSNIQINKFRWKSDRIRLFSHKHWMWYFIDPLIIFCKCPKKAKEIQFKWRHQIKKFHRFSYLFHSLNSLLFIKYWFKIYCKLCGTINACKLNKQYVIILICLVYFFSLPRYGIYHLQHTCKGNHPKLLWSLKYHYILYLWHRSKILLTKCY